MRAKPDAAAVAAVDAARAALLDEVDAADVGEHLGHRRRGRARRHPPLRLHPPRVRRLALVGDRGPRARQKTVTVDEVVLLPGDEAIVAPAVGALPRAHPARRPVARRPAARRGRRPAAGADVLLRRRPARRRREGAGPRGRRRTSAWAGSARSRWRAATSPPSAGTTATAARTRRWRRRAPDTCTTCGFLVRLAGPLVGAVRRLRQRRRQRRRPRGLRRPRLRRALRGAAGQEARAAPAAGPRSSTRSRRRRARDLLRPGRVPARAQRPAPTRRTRRSAGAARRSRPAGPPAAPPPPRRRRTPRRVGRGCRPGRRAGGSRPARGRRGEQRRPAAASTPPLGVLGEEDHHVADADRRGRTPSAGRARRASGVQRQHVVLDDLEVGVGRRLWRDQAGSGSTATTSCPRAGQRRRDPAHAGADVEDPRAAGRRARRRAGPRRRRRRRRRRGRRSPAVAGGWPRRRAPSGSAGPGSGVIGHAACARRAPCAGAGSTPGRTGRARSRPGRSTATTGGRRPRGARRRAAAPRKASSHSADADLDGADAVDVERLDVGDDVGAVADLVLHRLVVAEVHAPTLVDAHRRLGRTARDPASARIPP